MFMALIIQEIDGCDYSIRCGGDWFPLDSATKDAAIKELHKLVIGDFDPVNYKVDGDIYGHDGNYWSEQILEKAVLIEVNEKINIPLKQWYSDAKQKASDYIIQIENDKEKAEYERLKAKFGKE